MTLFQKLKIKLFGKERWRVVDSAEAGDIVVYRGGALLDVIDWRNEWYINQKLNYLDVPCTIYRKVN